MPVREKLKRCKETFQDHECNNIFVLFVSLNDSHVLIIVGLAEIMLSAHQSGLITVVSG